MTLSLLCNYCCHHCHKYYETVFMKQTNYNGKDPSIEALITQATSDEVIYHQNYLMIEFASNSIKPFLNFHESKESEISWVTKRFITPSVDHSFSLFKKKNGLGLALQRASPLRQCWLVICGRVRDVCG